MSSYVTVPGSNAKLTDGTVVMLQRFPGTKWIVHNGWYSYNGRQYSGWYFSSIPSQTTMPMNPSDLRGIVVVSASSNEGYEYPDYPEPEGVHPHPGPGPYPEPYPDDKFGPNPFPPMPPFPPFPPGPGPHPQGQVPFTKTDKKFLDAAFITVETLRDFEAIHTSRLPDGKIVCVNSVNGKRKYYRWNKRDDEWEEIDVTAIIDDEIAYALEGYAKLEDVDTAVSGLRNELQTTLDDISTRIDQSSESIESLEVRLAALTQTEEEDVAELTAGLDGLTTELNELKIVVAENAADVGSELEGVNARLENIEDSIFNIKKIVELLGSNTILVSNEGGIADSGVAIGDDEIGEISEYADDKTVATEKAVASLVERSQTRWASF